MSLKENTMHSLLDYGMKHYSEYLTKDRFGIPRAIQQSVGQEFSIIHYERGKGATTWAAIFAEYTTLILGGNPCLIVESDIAKRVLEQQFPNLKGDIFSYSAFRIHFPASIRGRRFDKLILDVTNIGPLGSPLHEFLESVHTKVWFRCTTLI